MLSLWSLQRVVRLKTSAQDTRRPDASIHLVARRCCPAYELLAVGLSTPHVLIRFCSGGSRDALLVTIGLPDDGPLSAMDLSPDGQILVGATVSRQVVVIPVMQHVRHHLASHPAASRASAGGIAGLLSSFTLVRWVDNGLPTTAEIRTIGVPSLTADPTGVSYAVWWAADVQRGDRQRRKSSIGVGGGEGRADYVFLSTFAGRLVCFHLGTISEVFQLQIPTNASIVSMELCETAEASWLLLETVREPRMWRLPLRVPGGGEGTDGAQWIVEGDKRRAGMPPFEWEAVNVAAQQKLRVQHRRQGGSGGSPSSSEAPAPSSQQCVIGCLQPSSNEIILSPPSMPDCPFAKIPLPPPPEDAQAGVAASGAGRGGVEGGVSVQLYDAVILRGGCVLTLANVKGGSDGHTVVTLWTARPSALSDSSPQWHNARIQEFCLPPGQRVLGSLPGYDYEPAFTADDDSTEGRDREGSTWAFLWTVECVYVLRGATAAMCSQLEEAMFLGVVIQNILDEESDGTEGSDTSPKSPHPPWNGRTSPTREPAADAGGGSPLLNGVPAGAEGTVSPSERESRPSRDRRSSLQRFVGPGSLLDLQQGLPLLCWALDLDFDAVVTSGGSRFFVSSEAPAWTPTLVKNRLTGPNDVRKFALEVWGLVGQVSLDTLHRTLLAVPWEPSAAPFAARLLQLLTDHWGEQSAMQPASHRWYLKNIAFLLALRHIEMERALGRDHSGPQDRDSEGDLLEWADDVSRRAIGGAVGSDPDHPFKCSYPLYTEWVKRELRAWRASQQHMGGEPAVQQPFQDKRHEEGELDVDDVAMPPPLELPEGRVGIDVSGEEAAEPRTEVEGGPASAPAAAESAELRDGEPPLGKKVVHWPDDLDRTMSLLLPFKLQVLSHCRGGRSHRKFEYTPATTVHLVRCISRSVAQSLTAPDESPQASLGPLFFGLFWELLTHRNHDAGDDALRGYRYDRDASDEHRVLPDGRPQLMEAVDLARQPLHLVLLAVVTLVSSLRDIMATLMKAEPDTSGAAAVEGLVRVTWEALYAFFCCWKLAIADTPCALHVKGVRASSEGQEGASSHCIHTSALDLVHGVARRPDAASSQRRPTALVTSSDRVAEGAENEGARLVRVVPNALETFIARHCDGPPSPHQSPADPALDAMALCIPHHIDGTHEGAEGDGRPSASLGQSFAACSSDSHSMWSSSSVTDEEEDDRLSALDHDGDNTAASGYATPSHTPAVLRRMRRHRPIKGGATSLKQGFGVRLEATPLMVLYGLQHFVMSKWPAGVDQAAVADGSPPSSVDAVAAVDVGDWMDAVGSCSDREALRSLWEGSARSAVSVERLLGTQEAAGSDGRACEGWDVTSNRAACDEGVRELSRVWRCGLGECAGFSGGMLLAWMAWRHPWLFSDLPWTPHFRLYLTHWKRRVCSQCRCD
ncbi:unnamed protein product [Vitrella brassicaformis CCMP3155]|uniref:Uncharacterized protein n=2 Tax=Vitrella brassicaformis TaxID=1169539 RepID=A0A0G4EX73_VITBC|nr:unnamed protein product [Vitrella brassicaformis CCMP3155]|eukprot:CEM02695.1 unnamed protein product [Vitrella brassicaformis CCMP3155]